METPTQHELPAVLAVEPPHAKARASSSPSSLQMELLIDEHGLYVRLPLTRGMFALVDFEDLETIEFWKRLKKGAAPTF